ncbi:MAG: hypothetical protein P8L85_23240 [Rubripirellula sp.]|nr:hypothetical protein [Rubripirellula sp.]
MNVVRIVARIGCQRLIWAVALVGLVVAVTPCSLVSAQETEPALETEANRSPAELKSDVLQWVDELDASSLSKRRAAEKALVEAGPAALEFLPEEKSGVSPEAMERLLRVREILQSIRTEKEMSADSVEIRLDKVSTLRDALEAISLESRVEFEYRVDESTPVAPVKSPLPFWHAVDYVLDQAQLDINFYGGGQGTLELVPREEGRPSRVDSAAYAEVYRIEATSVNSRRNLRQPILSGLNVSLEISWDPRLTPIGLTVPIDQLAGQLDDESALEPQDSGANIDISTNSNIAFSEFFLPLKLPSGRPGKIESLTGVLRALLPGKRQLFELPLSGADQKKKIDSMELEIESVRENGPLHEVRLLIQLDDAGRSLESHRQWIFQNDVYVRRKDGSRADHLGFEVFRQSDKGVGIGYLFDLGEAVNESTLVYQSPTVVVPSEIPFIIQDITLP